MVNFHSYISLPEGNFSWETYISWSYYSRSRKALPPLPGMLGSHTKYLCLVHQSNDKLQRLYANVERLLPLNSHRERLQRLDQDAEHANPSRMNKHMDAQKLAPHVFI